MNTQNRVSISAKASFDRTSNTSHHLGVLQRPPELKDPFPGTPKYDGGLWKALTGSRVG
jgi:hypothetical protein